MRARKIFREFAKHEGKEAKEFDRLDPDWYGIFDIYTKDSNGEQEKTNTNYEELFYWLIKNFNITEKGKQNDTK